MARPGPAGADQGGTRANTKIKLVYLCSLRNAAADRAGQTIAYKGGSRYMRSPLEYLAQVLNTTPLGERYSLEAVLHDDDPGLELDREKLQDYGCRYRPGKPWFFPGPLQVQGRRVVDLLECVPSAYRRLPPGVAQRAEAKRAFEHRLHQRLSDLDAGLVLIDGLLVILDELVRPGNPFHRKIVNIHPGITRADSPYQRRGACATLDALYGARGVRIVDRRTLATRPAPPVMMTGASFHYVDAGIDSGEVIVDVLQTPIDPEDTILELRWNNFHRSLFPALQSGLEILAERV